MSHTAHTWVTGDVINAAPLNALETDLAATAATADANAAAIAGLGSAASQPTTAFDAAGAAALRAPLLTPTATKTATYAVAVGELAMMNVASGATVLTLPAAPADKAQVGYRAIGATTAVPLTISASGSDSIGTTGATSASIALADEVAVLQYQASSTRWLAVSNVKTQASLDTAYGPLVRHATVSPNQPPQTYSSGRTICGIDGTSAGGSLGPHRWSYTGSALYQADDLTGGSWTAVTVPTNFSTVNFAKVIAWPAMGKFYLIGTDTVTGLCCVWSCPAVAAGGTYTWTKLLSLHNNATVIQTAFRLTSVGLYVGEYSGGAQNSGTTPPYQNAVNDIGTGGTPGAASSPWGPSVYLSTDGATFSSVLGPLSSVRHIHGIYEDPYNLGSVWVTAGDQNAAHFVYNSTTGAAGTFNPVTTLDANANLWQAVGMGFDANNIWFVSDQVWGSGPYIIDRTTRVPRWATLRTYPAFRPVPGGAGGRYITDAVFNSTTTITSATAAFTSFDKGRFVEGNLAIPEGTYIASVTNATTVVLSQAATNSTSSNTVAIQGDTFFGAGYVGAVDPATGYCYVVMNDGTVGGTVAGLFCIPGKDQDWVLMRCWFNYAIGNVELYINNGKIYVGRYGPINALSKV